MSSPKRLSRWTLCLPPGLSPLDLEQLGPNEGDWVVDQVFSQAVHLRRLTGPASAVPLRLTLRLTLTEFGNLEALGILQPTASEVLLEERVDRQRAATVAHFRAGGSVRLFVAKMRPEVAELDTEITALPGLSCKAGCSACCHVVGPVAASIAEVIDIADTLRHRRARRGVESLQVVAARVEAAARAERDPARAGQRRPCPLLTPQGLCTVHTHRPLECRTRHSFDQKACERHEIPPHSEPLWRLGAQLQAAQIEGLRQVLGPRRSAAHLVSLAQGLQIALADPGAEDKWLEASTEASVKSRVDWQAAEHGWDDEERARRMKKLLVRGRFRVFGPAHLNPLLRDEQGWGYLDRIAAIIAAPPPLPPQTPLGAIMPLLSSLSDSLAPDELVVASTQPGSETPGIRVLVRSVRETVAYMGPEQEVYLIEPEQVHQRTLGQLSGEVPSGVVVLVDPELYVSPWVQGEEVVDG